MIFDDSAVCYWPILLREEYYCSTVYETVMHNMPSMPCTAYNYRARSTASGLTHIGATRHALAPRTTAGTLALSSTALSGLVARGTLRTTRPPCQ